MPKRKQTESESNEPESTELETPEETVTPEPATDEQVRVYEVTASMIMHQFTPNQRGKLRGEQVASIEFKPPEGVSVEDLEKRYLETGGLKLVETISRAEWDKRQAK